MGIRVEGLRKNFGQFVALDQVSFTVPRGSLAALLGPSGGGKSTLLRIIAGLETADAGEVYLHEEALAARTVRRGGVGFVFQHYALFRHMTVAQNVGFALTVQKVPRAEVRTRVQGLLGMVGLSGLAERYPDQLSGGQRQRAALARALAPAPRLLLLDEPFGAVDAKVREELRRWLRRLHDEMHVTSLFVTHDQDEAFEVADQVVLINHGRVEQSGAPRDILDEPANEFVARFCGEANVLTAKVYRGQAHAGGLVTAAPGYPDGTLLRLVVRSYDIKMWHDNGGIGTVTRLLALGDRVRVEAEVAQVGSVVAQFPRRSSLLVGVVEGSRVAIEITLARLYPVY